MQNNKTLRLLVICNALSVMVFFTSCFTTQKTNDSVPASRYRLTITLAPGASYTALNSVLAEPATNNLHFNLEGTFQDLKLGSRSISFLFNNNGDLNDFRERLLSEGIPIQIISIEKLD
jgi:hypothetical protein